MAKIVALEEKLSTGILAAGLILSVIRIEWNHHGDGLKLSNVYIRTKYISRVHAADEGGLREK